MTHAVIKPEPARVDGNTGQIVEVHPTTQEIVAKVKDFLDCKEKKVYFNGKRYPEYEDFQYIGTFYGITVKTFDPHFVEIAGRKGFTAKAMLLRDNLEIGRAEAFCLDDEPNWRSKPLFQLASMAQTRAAAKAYANLFRPIVRMAGIEGSPAEEMTEGNEPHALPVRGRTQEEIDALGQRLLGSKTPTDDIPPTPHDVDEADEFMPEETFEQPIPDHPKPKPEPEFRPDPSAPKLKKISDKQKGLIWYKCKEAGISEAMQKAWIDDNWKVKRLEDLPWQAMKPMLEWITDYKGMTK